MKDRFDRGSWRTLIKPAGAEFIQHCFVGDHLERLQRLQALQIDYYVVLGFDRSQVKTGRLDEQRWHQLTKYIWVLALKGSITATVQYQGGFYTQQPS